MTPQQKAIDLFNNFNNLGKDFTRGVSMKEFSKECAIIVVREIINSRKEEPRFDDTPFMYSEYYTTSPLYLNYWLEVEKEIKKL